MKLQLLGTGGYHPSEERHTACYFLPDVGVVLDAGTGFFRVAPRLKTKELQIFLSHAHLDHVVGLTYFQPAFKLGLVERVRVYAQAAVVEAVRSYLFENPIFSGRCRHEFVVLEEGRPVEIPSGGQVTFQPLVNHTGGSTAYRIDWPGFSLAYVTDTTVDGSYTQFVRGVDLLLHECTFMNELKEMAEEAKHSYAQSVGELAKEAQVGRLILCHLDPWLNDYQQKILEQVQAVFEPVELARDLKEVEFNIKA